MGTQSTQHPTFHSKTGEHAQPRRLNHFQLIVIGHVQGVGFRPFVYRLAISLQLRGWVQNQLGQVVIAVEGERKKLLQFCHDLIHLAPPLAKPILEKQWESDYQHYQHFTILPSEQSATPQIFVPADFFTCEQCYTELNDPHDRRYRYPFINCTQCGPRYTLIRALPYDRANTTMANFPLCKACLQEYQNPADRRFHAEPIACPICGPQISFEPSGNSSQLDSINETQAALAAAVNALRRGEIIAVKGIGGYHLLCDASDDNAVQRLRKRKQRPDKPLAVMFRSHGHDPLVQLRNHVELVPAAKALLISPMRPIVLASKKPSSSLSDLIAPGLNEIGVFLPYSPLHHLLLNDFNGPLVATSANLSGEPVITDNLQASNRLKLLADAFVHHNRPIQRPADDPVFRSINQRLRPIRLGRGCTPLELTLPWQLEQPILAVGGHLKNTIALAWENRVVISPHIGEMNSPRSLNVFEQLIADLQVLYGQSIRQIVCDRHPGYTTHRWAKQQKWPVESVLHHFAHASALIGEHFSSSTDNDLKQDDRIQEDLKQDTLVLVWDGIGYGGDGTLWGGETLLGAPGRWQRVASMKPFNLPGGDKASREPWRCAAALCWQTDFSWQNPFAGISAERFELVRSAWQKRLNCPQSSAVGRLFDAAAALIMAIETCSFEGQAPMQLEAIASGKGNAVGLPLYQDNDNLWRCDWSPLLTHLTDTRYSAAERAADFHQSLAAHILQQAVHFKKQTGVTRIGLCGGVFQNRRLTESAAELLAEKGFKVILAEQLPCNDAAISFGQIVEQAASLHLQIGVAEQTLKEKNHG